MLCMGDNPCRGKKCAVAPESRIGVKGWAGAPVKAVWDDRMGVVILGVLVLLLDGRRAVAGSHGRQLGPWRRLWRRLLSVWMVVA